jgi:hypothetical protein
VALSDVGDIVAHTTRNWVRVHSVEKAQDISSYGVETQHKLAVHPSNQWLVFSKTGIELARIGEKTWRSLFLGGQSTLHHELMEKMSTIDLDQHRRTMKTAVEQMISGMASRNPPPSEEEIAAARSQLEANMAEILGQFERSQSGQPSSPPQSNEAVMCIGFTHDGNYLWCGTQNGLRVFEWNEVLASDVDMPAPKFRQDLGISDQWGNVQGYIYAVVEEPDGTGLVFGGITGAIYRLDLRNWTAAELLTLPEPAAVCALALTPDGKFLGTISTPSLRNRDQNDHRAIWQIWSYDRLRAAPTPS